MKEILINKIRASELVTDASTESEDRISGLTCPACGRSKAFCYKNNPDYIYCGGLKKCGAKTSTIDFLGIRKNIEKDYPPTKLDPNFPATAYLQTVRLLMLSLVGLVYKYFSNIRDLGCGAVMFPLGKDASGKEVWSGRIFNPQDGEGKTHNIGSISGKYFIHPGIIYNKNTDLYIAEGIFDALSMIEMGHAAIATLSANADISKLNLPPHRNLIFAYDNDPAGIKGMKKALKIYKNATALLLPERQDLNDFLITAGNSEKARKMFDARYKEFLFNADLALAANPKSYVEIFTDYMGYLPELFEHKGCYYSGRETRDGDLYTRRVSKFTVTIDHYKKAEDQKSTGHIFRYHLIIKTKKGHTTKITMEGHELTTAEQVRKAFLSRGKVLWEGDKIATMAFSRMIVDAKYAPIVRQIDVVGYDEVTQGYYFGDFAIDVQGNKLSPNAKGFFKVSAHESVVPFPYATIKPSEHPVDINHIYNL
ncbi:MAG: toprim domain-containing protein, partial [Thiotrichaceae bacterium]|nr:toprim domain-containing protein [Thiotrichaceae bacterium]